MQNKWTKEFLAQMQQDIELMEQTFGSEWEAEWRVPRGKSTACWSFESKSFPNIAIEFINNGSVQGYSVKGASALDVLITCPTLEQALEWFAQNCLPKMIKETADRLQSFMKVKEILG